MGPFLTGLLAGYGIAIPVGAIAVLILGTGIQFGFRRAAVAGAGAASADLVYSALAVIGGAALSELIGSVDVALKFGSALVLALIALNGLRHAGRVRAETETADGSRRMLVQTYVRFLGLTIINPTTVVYFAALVIGLGVASDMSAIDGVLFVAGTFIASLSWQTTLAAVGAVTGTRLSTGAQRAAIVAGNLLILAFAAAILLR
jgi:arginine exporter protein ArgO